MQTESTVFVVDKDARNRVAVSDLAGQMNLRCLGYESGRAFLDAYDNSLVGCLVMEVRIPDMGGLQIQQHLAQEAATLPVIFLTAHADAATAVRAMRAGALQFFEKPFHESDLWDAIQEAIALDRELRRERAAQLQRQELLERLTSKERDVLEMVIEGKSSKAASEQLGVCVRTVELRRSSLMKKLEVSSLTDLLRLIGSGNGWNLQTGNGGEGPSASLQRFLQRSPGMTAIPAGRYNGRSLPR